jgi:hypothetical protein
MVFFGSFGRPDVTGELCFRSPYHLYTSESTNNPPDGSATATSPVSAIQLKFNEEFNPATLGSDNHWNRKSG